MDQMNVSITDRLVDYVRNKVESGRYNNASEVVRDALRRMEDEEARELRIAAPAADDIVADLTALELESIRARVREGIEQMERGEFTEYAGREGLNKLSASVKERGRKLLARNRAKVSRE